jgi:hypothetical protein
LRLGVNERRLRETVVPGARITLFGEQNDRGEDWKPVASSGLDTIAQHITELAVGVDRLELELDEAFPASDLDLGKPVGPLLGGWQVRVEGLDAVRHRPSAQKGEILRELLGQVSHGEVVGGHRNPLLFG